MAVSYKSKGFFLSDDWQLTRPLRKPQSRQSAKLFLQSSELGLTQLLTRERAGHPRWRERGWESPNSDEGYTVVLCTLWRKLRSIPPPVCPSVFEKNGKAQQVGLMTFFGKFLTIYDPVDYMAGDIMILMRARSIIWANERNGPWNLILIFVIERFFELAVVDCMNSEV